MRTFLALMLLFPAAAMGQDKAALSGATGVPASSITVKDGRVNITGKRNLTADEVLASENFLLIKNATITSPNGGTMNVRELRSDKPELLAHLISSDMNPDCTGEPSSMTVDDLVMLADSDSLLGAEKPERMFARSASVTLATGKNCIFLRDVRLEQMGSFGADGSSIIVQSGSAHVTASGVKMDITRTGIFSADGVAVMGAGNISAEIYNTDLSRGVSVEMTEFSTIPSSFLYPDLLARFQISEPDVPLTGSVSFNVKISKEDTNIYGYFSGERLGEVKFGAVLKGDIMEAPESVFLVDASGGFRDEGFFEMMKKAGKPLPDSVRDGSLLPAQLRGQRLSKMRGAVAEWLAQGEGSFRAHPALPLNAVMAGAALVFGEEKLISALNITAGKEFN